MKISILFHNWMKENEWKHCYAESIDIPQEELYKRFLLENKIDEPLYSEKVRREIVMDFEKDLAKKDKQIAELKEKLLSEPNAE